jgi:Leucine Rich Repeat (LRR) protein
MDSHDRASRLQELLRLPPSSQNWRNLWVVFRDWPDEPARERAVSDAVVQLESWDDELRHLSSQNGPLYSGDGLSPLARLMRSVDFSRREAGNEHLTRIAQSPYTDELRRIALIRSDFDPGAISALGSSQHLKALTHLKLDDTYLGTKMTPFLLAPTGLFRLTNVELREAGIRDESMTVLTGSSLPERLTYLSLANNRLTDESARVLAGLSTLAKLTTLDLSENQITAAGRHMLQKAPHLASTKLIF